ncbi:unnamed protein product, partial [marine sediment metagenome]
MWRPSDHLPKQRETKTMAGPIFRVAVVNKADTTQRMDLLTAWADDKFPEQLRVSIAEETDADES